MAVRGPEVWLWRWRRNPLKRRADKVEAWVVLVVWTCTVVAGVLAGLGAARSVEQGLARERAEWRPVVAHLTERAPGAAGGDRVWAEVSWRAADGSAHAGQVRVRPGSAAGGPVTVWTDPRGRLVAKPATAAQARLRSVLLGSLAGVSTAIVPFVAGRALCGRLEQRRLDQWEAEWARFDPLWGRGRTG
ncbi:hypothetical protein C3489_32140 [Streptomyces sp. Ru71]|uniref:Rv1733c family protein n=1 Tax=Streptomyces sp. Ru71 TaxID=2080746 RepID=UPI000CDD5550|nr:hypothetical protein [Streptomyces sp. Ru71]POX46336.1 hypothetical protein C3489_32140 [Streptomyces sp. Ru71]